MNWLRSHPYAAGALGAAILLVGGMFVVLERSAVAPQPANTTAWGGAGAQIMNTTSYSPAPQAQTPPPRTDGQTIAQRVLQNPPYTYTPPPAQGTGASGENASDFDSFLALLEQSAGKKPPAPSSGATTDAYAFIPSGFISTSTGGIERTAIQQKLYDYGNDAGSYIQSFEDQHSDMIQILKNQLEDRTDANKAAAVAQLAQGLTDIGNSLLSMDNIPPAVAVANANLANSYKDMGEKLALVPKALRDSDLVAAITAYNAAADSYATRFVALVNIFGSYGVKFDAQDAGSIFSFNANSL